MDIREAIKRLSDQDLKICLQEINKGWYGNYSIDEEHISKCYEVVDSVGEVVTGNLSLFQHMIVYTRVEASDRWLASQ